MLWTLGLASLLGSDLHPSGLLAAWSVGVAPGSLPWLADVPAAQRRILNGCLLALMVIWCGVLNGLRLIDSEEDFLMGFWIALSGLGLTLVPGLWLVCQWIASALYRLRDPLRAARCEAARVLMLALPAAFPVGALGYRVSETLFETGAGWELSGPGLLGPRWAGALSGAGVCVLGALWLRLRCARRAFDRAGEVA